jgi:hypothetical protein
MPWYRNKKLLTALGVIVAALGTPLAIKYGLTEEQLASLMDALVEAFSAGE